MQISTTLRDAGRGLLRNPRLSGPVVVILALAVGANAAVFSWVDSILLESLPYPQAERLAMAWTTLPGTPGPEVVSWPNFLDWRRQSRTFEGLAAFNVAEAQMTGGNEPEDLLGAAVSGDFFHVLEIKPWLGRFFGPGEGTPDDAQGIVLSFRLWQRRFNGTPAILGKRIDLDGVPKRVLGVAPADFRQPDPLSSRETDYWVTVAPESWVNNRQADVFRVIGRLKKEVSLRSGQSEMNAIARRLATEYPASNSGSGIRLMPLHQELVGDIRPSLLMLTFAMAALLLVASASASNQILAYHLRREKDFLVRIALGAGKGALALQLLLQSMVLALVSGLLGALLGVWASGWLGRSLPLWIPGIRPIHFGLPAVGFTFLLTLASGLLMSLPPLVKLAWPAKAATSLYGTTAGSPHRQRLRSALLVGEIASVLPLLAAAALLAQSVLKLQRVDPGFEPKDLLTFRLGLPSASYPEPAQIRNFYERLLDRLARLPGVESVGAVSTLPLTDINDREMSFVARGVRPREGLDTVHDQVVSPNYFRAMRIALIKGRTFEPSDLKGAMRVVIVNRSLAGRLWPQEDPVGKQLAYDYGPQYPKQWLTVVGVVGDVRQQRLRGGPTAVFYRPIAQDQMSSLAIVIRDSKRLSSLSVDVKAQIHNLDPRLALADLQPMTHLLEGETAGTRFLAFLLEAVAAAVLLVTVLGLVGLTTYLTSQRSREIAIRVALGATRREALAELVKPTLRLLLLGIALGLAVTFAARPLLAAFLFGLSGVDPVTLFTATLTLLGVGLLASYLPARALIRSDLRAALQVG